MDIRQFYTSFSPEALENGKRIYAVGGVIRITRGLSGRFYGTVRDRYVEYNTRVTLDGAYNATELGCSCPANGFCAHQAAFLTAVLEHLEENVCAGGETCHFSDHGYAALCAEYIATASRGRETPAVARRIVAMERVNPVFCQKVSNGAHKIRARIGGHNRFSNIAEDTELTVDSRCLPTEGRCGCMPDGGAFLCEHMAALLFYLFPEESAPEVTTSDAVRRLIEDARPLDTETEKPETLNLVPELSLGFDSRLILSFLVGSDRMFSVRSISEFLDAVKTGSKVTYGKNFVFDHSIEAFTPKAQSYIRFLRSRRGDEMPFYGRSGAGVTLNENNIDDFFAIHGGDRIIFNSAETEIISADPKFKTLFSPAGRMGCRISFDGEDILPLGHGERSYVLSGGKIYICSRDFSKKTARLISDLAVAGSDGLLMSGSDMGRFFSRVIRPLRGLVSWRFSDPSLEARLPRELKAIAKISTFGPDSARAEVEFFYGDTKFPLFQREKDPDTRDTALEAKIEKTVAKYFPRLLPLESAAEIRGDSGAVFNLAREGLAAIEALTEVELVSGPPPRLRRPADIRFALDLQGGLLDINIDTGEYDLSELAEILSALDRGETFFRFADGSFADLGEENFTDFAEVIKSLNLTPGELAKNMKLPLFRMLYLDAVAKEKNAVKFDRSSAFRRIASLPLPTPEDSGVPAEFLKLLRPYQEEGFMWMQSLELRGFGGILADDMGLGKTVQALALVLSNPPENSAGLPVLVVCPTSLVANWAAEVRHFAPEIDLCVVSGPAEARTRAISELKSCQLGITSYDSLKRDLPYYAEISFRAVISDEAQYIKNRSTQAANAVKGLSSRVKFALTGTPVENSPAELWSIFDYLMPGYLGTYADFRRVTELPIAEGEPKALARLRNQTSPFILRRVKKDVLRELPEKTESVLYTGLAGEQKKAYAAVSAALIEELREQLAAETNPSRRFDVLTMLLRLRQVCCHPPLALGASYTGESAKLELCMDLLSSLKDGGHRVLLFSQFTSMLSVLADRLKAEGMEFFSLTGRTPVAERLELVQRFNSGEGFVFLISLKAGGTGLNLTGADTVIHYDPWWNMAAQNQATDRAHRIGQEHHVHVWRLIAENTVEQKILELQEKKASLAEALLDGAEGSAATMTAQELIAMLES